MHRRDLVALTAAAWLPSGATHAAYGPSGIQSFVEDWPDARRGHSVRVRIRLPADPGPRPVVLILPGLAGVPGELGYLGTAMAEAGFVAIHYCAPRIAGTPVGELTPDHLLAAAAVDLHRATQRLKDASFLLDDLVRRQTGRGRLAGRLDLTRIAVAGRSYGAMTAQRLIGQRGLGGDHGLNLPDPRLRAAIAVSPLPARGLPPHFAYARVATPLLSIIGSEDDSHFDEIAAAERAAPFHAIAAAPQVMAVLAGADHAAFGQSILTAGSEQSSEARSRTAALAVAFLKAVLLRDADAADLLRSGAPGILGAHDRLEVKGF